MDVGAIGGIPNLGLVVLRLSHVEVVVVVEFE